MFSLPKIWELCKCKIVTYYDHAIVCKITYLFQFFLFFETLSWNCPINVYFQWKNQFCFEVVFRRTPKISNKPKIVPEWNTKTKNVIQDHFGSSKSHKVLNFNKILNFLRDSKRSFYWTFRNGLRKLKEPKKVLCGTFRGSPVRGQF